MKTLIKKYSSELERLCQTNISINKAFDIMEASAKSSWDVVIINVMRDSFHELIIEEKGIKLFIEYDYVFEETLCSIMDWDKLTEFRLQFWV